MTVIDTTNLQTSYLEVNGEIPLNLPEGAFISLTRNNPRKIYSLGFQPAKTIPEIPRWFLQKYGGHPFTVLEPFAGSGTTLIESLSYGASVLWLDYQPLSRLICQVKTTRFPYVEALQEAKKLVQRAFMIETVPASKISFANRDFWFQEPVREGLEILRDLIQEVSRELQPVFWLAFSSTVRKVSNMNDSMILAAKRPNVSEIPERTRSEVFKFFQYYLEKTIEAIAEWDSVLSHSPGIAEELPGRDARQLNGDWLCDAVITSPPYINAIDYVWAAKFELHWLGMVQDDQDRLNLYSCEIGTERISREEVKELGRTGILSLDAMIEDIYTGRFYKASKGQNELRARVVYKYFEDMRKHFVACYKHVRPGGYYCFSIGDISKICGVDIPVASLLTKIACQVGFREQFHFHLLLKNRKLNVPRAEWAGIIKHDTVVVLEKPVT